MNTKMILNSLPKNIKEILKTNQISNLYPPQAQAIEKGLFSEQNMILSMPTASGKTLIAELAMLKTILSKGDKCLYIVPLRALASEKYDDFKEKYSYLGINTGIATGDFDYIDSSLTRNDILIATAEKVDSLLRQKPTWLCSALGCVIVDEIHYIGDPQRGPTLETVITRLININPKLKILGLSATIANAHALAQWLNATLVTSTWRPVILKEGVYCQGQIRFADGSSKILADLKLNDEIAALAIDCVNEKGQVLIFLNTRKSAQAEARRVAQAMGSYLTAQERLSLKDLSDKILKSTTETTKLSQQLSECIKNGVVFHHAGLHHAHRKLIEDSFRKNTIKVICATPTLAAGVNLPSRRTIIRGLYRYASGMGMRPVRVMEYKQMSGRAGRPKYDQFGESILLSKNKQEQSELFANFIFADPEPIQSHLGNENALRVHLLSLITTGFISSIKTAFQFIEKTFFSYQKQHYDLSEMIIEIIEFLKREEMIKEKNDKLLPTAFGTRTSRLYIDPISAVIIRDCLRAPKIKISTLNFLYIICCLPDMIRLTLNKSDIEKVVAFADKNKEPFKITLSLAEDFSLHLAKIKTVWMFNQWINEEKEESICEFFGVGPGDIHRFVDTAAWLVYASCELAKLFKISNTKPLYQLRAQIRYGIKLELVELANLKGIGRIRARNLFTKGYTSLTQLKNASLEKLQKVPNIGKEVALGIKKQLQTL